MYTKKRLKIFVDGYLLNKEYQGTRTYIKELYKEFALHNPNATIHIGCFKNNELEDEFSKHTNVEFIYFKHHNRILRMILEIPKIISDYGFNYAHFQYVIPPLKPKDCKYIVTIHDVLFNDHPQYFSFLYRLKRNFLFKQSARKSDILITVSEYSKRRIKKLYKIRDKEIFITPNAVRKVFFEEYDKQKSVDYIRQKFKVDNYLLYVSRIEPRKNQQVILSIFPEIENEKLKVVFIGSKTLNNKSFEKKYHDLPKKQRDKIYFFDSISDSDLLEFYKACKVFVYPSFAEGFGIPPLEAAALKIPVICSKNTALNDFCFFEPYHILIQDISLLKSKVKHILINKNKLNLIEIQKKIKISYSWEKSSQNLLEAINTTT